MFNLSRTFLMFLLIYDALNNFYSFGVDMTKFISVNYSISMLPFLGLICIIIIPLFFSLLKLAASEKVKRNMVILCCIWGGALLLTILANTFEAQWMMGLNQSQLNKLYINYNVLMYTDITFRLVLFICVLSAVLINYLKTRATVNKYSETIDRVDNDAL